MQTFNVSNVQRHYRKVTQEHFEIRKFYLQLAKLSTAFFESTSASLLLLGNGVYCPGLG